MTVPRIYLATYEAVKAKYPKIGPDAWASAAAEIVKRGLAAFGADGFVNFRPEVATLAPRLAPPVQITENMTGEQRQRAYYAQLARSAETLPVQCATPRTVADPVDRQKVNDAMSAAARYRTAKEIRDQQLKEANDHAQEIRENASKMGGT